MPREVLSQEQIERLQEEHKILLECVKEYADAGNWATMDTDYLDTWYEDEHGYKTAQETLQKIKELNTNGK
jgi:hypothetical protein